MSRVGQNVNMLPPIDPIIAQFSARSCRSSNCQGRLSTAWVVSLVVFSCRMVSTRPYTHIADYICAFCPLSLTHMLVFLSLYI